MPTLSALRRRAAWFSQARVNFLPTNTAVGHSTIATGTDPAVHGVTVNSVYDRLHRRRQDLFAGMMPQALMALTLADVWQLTTAGRAIVLAQGSIDRAATPLAGHGACQPNGAPVVLASYDEETGAWHSNPDCFRLPDYLKDRKASTLWSGGERVAASQNRFACGGPSFGALPRLRSRRDDRHDRARAAWRRRMSQTLFC